MSNAQVFTARKSSDFRWRTGLWFAQLWLAMLFGAAGAMKIFFGARDLAAIGLSYASEVPPWLLPLVGTLQVVGAGALVLPAITRITPSLTPVAAAGFVVIQILTLGFSYAHGSFMQIAPYNFPPLWLSLFVLWGRTRKAPNLSR